MVVDLNKNKNLKTALILASIAIAFFIGALVRQWLMK